MRKSHAQQVSLAPWPQFGERKGFTLIELLVVITIIGILMSLTFPAVQQVRELAMTLTCRNKLKNLATAVRTHESLHQSFPPGSPSCTKEFWRTGGTSSPANNFCQGPNWLCNILAEMDQPTLAEQMYNAFEQSSQLVCASDDLEHEAGALGTWTPSFCICPVADKMSPEKALDRNDWALDPRTTKGNYAACWGSDTYTPPADNYDDARPYNPLTAGAFTVVKLPETNNIPQDGNTGGKKAGAFKMGWGLGVKSSQIKDGASNTIMLSEVLGYDSTRDARGCWILVSMGSSNFTGKLTPNSSSANDHIPLCDTSIPEWNPLHCTENLNDGQVWAAARSRHLGGVNASFCDASARFISNAVDPGLWKSLSTRSGGEAASPP